MTGFWSTVLLGQGTYEHMGKRFRRGGGVDSGDFVLMFVILVAIAVVVILVARYFTRRQERGFNSPRALFAELCRAHGLNWTRRRLLRQLASYHRIPDCQLFLEPRRFAPQQLPEELAGYSNEIAAIHEALFGGDAAPAPQAKS